MVEKLVKASAAQRAKNTGVFSIVEALDGIEGGFGKLLPFGNVKVEFVAS